jgi:hypothetical protein
MGQLKEGYVNCYKKIKTDKSKNYIEIMIFKMRDWLRVDEN